LFFAHYGANNFSNDPWQIGAQERRAFIDAVDGLCNAGQLIVYVVHLAKHMARDSALAVHVFSSKARRRRSSAISLSSPMCSISLQSVGLIMPGPRKPGKIETRRNADRRVACAPGLKALAPSRLQSASGLAVYLCGAC
jgi:hypothetical protein